jgi:hypothetical protein
MGYVDGDPYQGAQEAIIQVQAGEGAQLEKEVLLGREGREGRQAIIERL